MANVKEWPRCKGKGSCPQCSGRGKTGLFNNTKSKLCDGTGKCPHCDGKCVVPK